VRSVVRAWIVAQEEERHISSPFLSLQTNNDADKEIQVRKGSYIQYHIIEYNIYVYNYK